MTLAEELRALAERIGPLHLAFDLGDSRKDDARSLYMDAAALAARAEREQSPERQAFVEAAVDYAAVMRRDARNAHDGEAVQRDIDRKRARFYETHRAMLAAEEKR